MRRRALAILAGGARGVALVAVFGGAVVLGVKLHANVAGFRRAGAEIGNRAMASVFEGRIVVERIDRLSIGPKATLDASSVEITDPDGRRVIHADGIHGTIDLRSLLRSIWRGSGPAVELEDAKIDKVEVVLDRGPDGAVTIARAFHTRSSGAAGPAKPAVDTGPSQHPPYLDIASARIGHGWVHGNLVPPALDGDADALKARVHLEHDVVRVDLDEGKVTLRAPHAPNQQVPIAGNAKGAIAITLGTTTISGHAELEGAAGAVPVIAKAAIDRDDVEATVDVARIDVTPLGQAFTGLPFGRPVEAHARAHGKLPVLAIDARARIGESDVTANGEIDLREGHGFRLDADAAHVDASSTLR